MRDGDTLERLGFSRYLFIYLVRDDSSNSQRFCTVITYGCDLASAEQVAINRVHQQGLHIQRTDTATPAPWLDPVCDGRFLAELEAFGSALETRAA